MGQQWNLPGLSFLHLFVFSACLTPLKRLCNPYLHASRQTCFQTTNFPPFDPEKVYTVIQKKLLKRPEARVPLFHHEHRLPLYQVYRLAHHSQDVESIPFAHDGNRLETVTFIGLYTLRETKLRFSFYMCRLLDRHTDVTTATRSARPPAEWIVWGRWLCVFYRCKVQPQMKKFKNTLHSAFVF